MSKKGKGSTIKTVSETSIMDEVFELLEKIVPEARPRVISWVCAKFNIRSLPQTHLAGTPGRTSEGFALAPSALAPKPQPAAKSKPRPAPLIKQYPVAEKAEESVVDKKELAKAAKDFKDIAKADKKQVRLKVSDLKAHDPKDMVFRVAYLFCTMRKNLLGLELTPKETLYEQIKKLKAFDENTEVFILNNNFLVKENDNIRLTPAVEGMARLIINEIRDKKVKGEWKPKKGKKK